MDDPQNTAASPSEWGGGYDGQTTNLSTQTYSGSDSVNGRFGYAFKGYIYLASPTVTKISPTTGSAGGGNSVVITGTRFTGVTSVNFGTTPAVFTVNSATQITAVSPAGAGVVNVTVVTNNGTSAISSADQFTYTASPTMNADLVVNTSGQKTAVTGREVMYAVNVTNYGPGTAQNVVVTDTLPAGTTFVSATSSNAAMMPAATTVNGDGTTTVTFTGGVDGRCRSGVLGVDCHRRHRQLQRGQRRDAHQ